MGAKNSGGGIELRKGARSETIRVVFQYQGKRCRESLSLSHTKNNIAYAKRLQGEVVNAIERGTFDYAEFFPNSRTAKLHRTDESAVVTPPEVRAATTVGDLLRDYLAIARHNLQLSSYNCYADVARTYLFPKWNSKPAAELVAKDLRIWIMGMSVKSKTIQLILTPLRNAIELGVTEGALDVNPFDSLKLGKILPRVQRVSNFKADPFDIDEIDAILNACGKAAERNLFLFAFTTGMRPSEYMALMWPSVRFDRHQVAVEAAFVDGELKNTTKTLSGLRNIDMRAGAYAALTAQQGQREEEAGLVFLNPGTNEHWTGVKRACQNFCVSGVMK